MTGSISFGTALAFGLCLAAGALVVSALVADVREQRGFARQQRRLVKAAANDGYVPAEPEPPTPHVTRRFERALLWVISTSTLAGVAWSMWFLATTPAR